MSMMIPKKQVITTFSRSYKRGGSPPPFHLNVEERIKMINLNIGEQTYEIKFGYKSLAKSGILKEVMETQKSMSDISKAQEEREKQRKNRENFPEYNIDEMGNPVEVEDDDSAYEDIAIMEMMLAVIAPLVLAGLQKQKAHPEFHVDYDNTEDVKAKIDLVIDLIDDYSDEEDSLDASDLFTTLVNELFEKGFLSKKSEKLEQTMIQTDATITPTDHLQPRN